MADQLQLRGGTTNEHSTFTGALREVTVDTDKDTLIVHDAATAGGHPLAKEDLSNVPTGTITSTMIADGTIVNADINASAEIAVSKLADGAARQLLQTDAAGTGVEWTNNVDVPGTLDVTSVATFDNIASHSLGAAATPSITFTGDTNTGLYSPGADQVAISTGGTGRLFVDASGRVGAGGSPTAYQLESRVSGNNGISINNSGNTGTDYSVLDFTQNGAQKGVVYTNNNNFTINAPAGPFYIQTNGSNALVVDSSQRVGVGTSTAYGILTTASTGINLSSTTVNLGADGANGCIVSDTTSTNNTGVGYWFRHGGLKAGIASSRVNTGNWGTDLRFYTHPTTTSDVNNVYERMRIDPAGNVGVGTTSPSYNAHITNSGTAGTLSLHGSSGIGYLLMGNTDTSSGPLVISSANQVLAISRGNSFSSAGGGTLTESLRIDSSGNVGIGTSSPDQRLEVSSGSLSTAVKISTSANQSAVGDVHGEIVFEGRNSSGTVYETAEIKSVCESSAGTRRAGLAFTTSGSTPGALSEKLRITNDGNVGIGTTSPSHGLDVTEGARAKYFQILNNGYAGTSATTPELYSPASGTLAIGANGSERARIDSSGRLLVGTSTTLPNSNNELFQVAGGSGTGIGLSRFTADANGAGYAFYKSRNGTTGNHTVVQTDDVVGAFYYFGSSGVNYQEAARISAAIEAGTKSTSSMPGRLVFSTTADGASSPTERMRIRQNGEVLIGGHTSVASYSRGFSFGDPASTSYLRIGHNTTGAAYSYVTFGFNTGDIGNIAQNSAGTAVSYNTTSDYRLKENVTAVTDGITRLQQLKPSRFNFIKDPNKTVDGFIAHEVQTVVPEAITGDKDAVDDDGNPVYQGIDQSKLVPLLTAALQEAIGEIESLKARVAALEAN